MGRSLSLIGHAVLQPGVSIRAISSWRAADGWSFLPRVIRR